MASRPGLRRISGVIHVVKPPQKIEMTEALVQEYVPTLGNPVSKVEKTSAAPATEVTRKLEEADIENVPTVEPTVEMVSMPELEKSDVEVVPAVEIPETLLPEKEIPVEEVAEPVLPVVTAEEVFPLPDVVMEIPEISREMVQKTIAAIPVATEEPQQEPVLPEKRTLEKEIPKEELAEEPTEEPA
ncbi:MAG: hypothetical protein Q4E67_00705 [Planctomycetia bacterium]|nr:hypothetical protein [Planctomycetia bacterium]